MERSLPYFTPFSGLGLRRTSAGSRGLASHVDSCDENTPDRCRSAIVVCGGVSNASLLHVRLALSARMVRVDDLRIRVAQNLNVRYGPGGRGTGASFEGLVLTASEDPESGVFKFSNTFIQRALGTYSVEHWLQT